MKIIYWVAYFRARARFEWDKGARDGYQKSKEKT